MFWIRKNQELVGISIEILRSSMGLERAVCGTCMMGEVDGKHKMYPYSTNATECQHLWILRLPDAGTYLQGSNPEATPGRLVLCLFLGTCSLLSRSPFAIKRFGDLIDDDT